MLTGRNVITPEDLSTEEIFSLMNKAEDIIESPKSYSNLCNGRIMGTLFFEPSTRTRLSFEAAMNRLGGRIIGFSEAMSSSTSKGESLADTIRVVSSYSDLLVMRHPKEGSALHATNYSSVPLINAGDGGHYHPTQTLTDLLTIYEEIGRFDNLTIGLCGDLKFGRTVHSLLKAMNRFDNNKFVLISPEELRLPDYIKSECFNKDANNYVEVEDLMESIGSLDVLYMTRVQRERFFNEADYVRLKDSYILTEEKMKLAKKDMAVLHPLPRVNEISTEVDKDPRALYFKQAKYGMYVRMALISQILGVK